MIEDRQGQVLRLQRTFQATPSLVFSIFTKAELIAVWFASSHGFRAHDVAVDLRPGGTWRLRNVKGETVEYVSGTYHEVVPDDRLCYSYHYEGTDFFSVISLRFERRDSATVLHFCQTGFPDEHSFTEHSRGWPFVLKLMQEALLAAHGVGTVWQGPGEPKLDSVAKDLEAARQRFEEQQRANTRK